MKRAAVVKAAARKWMYEGGLGSAHRHTHLCAPLADLLVVHAVDGAVFPFRRSGGEWGAVGVAGGGVEGEDAVALAAIHLDFALIEEGAVAEPVPVDLDFVADDFELKHGGEGGEIGRGFARTDGSEVDAGGLECRCRSL